MSVLSCAALLVPVLFAGADAIAPLHLPDCEMPLSRLELPAEPTSETQVVCIGAELPITFLFDSLLVPGSLELQDRERFEDVAPGTRSFTVVPPADLQAGERFKAVVRFADGSAPASATFMLVGHPALGMRQVNVFRRKRTVEDYQKELQEERRKSEQLRQELERIRLDAGRGGLTGLIASGLMAVGAKERGVQAKVIAQDGIAAPNNALKINGAFSYRSVTAAGAEGQEKGVRLAVAVKLLNPGTQPWTVWNAALLGENQEVKPLQGVWQSAPFLPGAVTPEMVVIELELMDREARGPFTLKLWDEGGKRLVTLGNVTFP